nr:MAG TPA: hypothetical protein [Caudoviricetes sp.]
MLVKFLVAVYGLHEQGINMSSVFKRLFYQKNNGESGFCNVYSDSDDCPDPRLYVIVDGRQGYIKIGSPKSSAASPLRCFVKSDPDREFAIWKYSPYANDEEDA